MIIILKLLARVVITINEMMEVIGKLKGVVIIICPAMVISAQLVVKTVS